MADEDKPSKTDLIAAFKKLRASPANKVCFDCGTKNPTWATVTYGVFICIDCSAVHRGLGVHLTFVRSITLDTNWTWLQLRAMQVGGNMNATQFFRVHGCTTTDSQQKYKSRAATLYKDKLHHLAVNAMRLHGTKLHIEALSEKSPDPMNPEDDDKFFNDHATPTDHMSRNTSQVSLGQAANLMSSQTSAAVQDNGEGPRVEHVVDNDDENGEDKPITIKKSTIGQRKPGAKKGLGAKKGKLGAQKVKSDFTAIEAEAEQADKEREEAAKSILFAANKKAEEEPEIGKLSSRLMVQDLSNTKERQQQEERLKHSDPKKVEQVERLGMGFIGGGGAKGAQKCQPNSPYFSGISHSVVADMVTIKQEGNKQKGGNIPRGSSRISRFNDDAQDDSWEFVGREPRNNEYDTDRKATDDDFFSQLSTSSSFSSKPSSKSNWDTFDENKKSPPSYSSSPGGGRSGGGRSSAAVSQPVGSQAADNGGALKKFGNAKSISSDAYFGGGSSDFETRSNLSRFEGSSAIGSADLFGNGTQSAAGGADYGYGSNVPDMADIKDSVRTGVTKVAGKLSSISSSMSNYINDNYSGY